MIKRIAWIGILCLLCTLSFSSFAEEGNPDEFVNPTRPPNAPEYKTDEPENLVAEQIIARSFYLMERDSEEMLMEREPELLNYPASTTKIMTALIAIKAFPDLSEKIIVSENAARFIQERDDASRVPFKANEEITMKDALYGLLLRSGNEAAIAIAEAVSGTEEAFVEEMNYVAQMLGCTNTHFVNSHGYHDPNHQTTARDLAIIMSAALNEPVFREIIGTWEYTLSQTMENPSRKIYNSNVHINPDPENERYYAFSIGGKTGFHSQSGYVIVEAAEKDGVELIAVIMYSSIYGRWPDTSRLFQYGFTKYTSVTPEDIYNENPIEVSISGFATDDKDLDGSPGLGEVELYIRAVDPSRQVRFVGQKEEIDAMLGNYNQFTNVHYEVELRAPITRGQIMGRIIFYPRNEEPAEYELIASRSVAARVDAPPTLEEIEARVAEDPNPFPPFSLDWVLPPVLILGAIVFGVRLLIRRLLGKRRKHLQVPKPKKRTFH